MSVAQTLAPPLVPFATPSELPQNSTEVQLRGVPIWKRVIDVVGSVCLIVLLAPLMLLVGLYIKLVSRGPVLFFQKRVGHGARDFTIYKFRTMESAPRADETHRAYVASLVHASGPAKKPEYAARLIRGGGLLRSLSLDELPQLFNVLLGTMSLIGPRPEVLKLEDYEPWQLRRFEVLPGISGLWQVSGKNRLTFRQMIHLDIHYVDHLSFRLDAWIAIKTIYVILLRRNH